ncbi:MAG: hypothetical protein Q27BB25_07125 [Blastomonas sp. CACIA14H2]|nr:MAG: hypothetical protein Q27BB25_07125 [Blastomonas sp. CACIA14H2]
MENEVTEPVDWMIRANARAKGKRPDFLGDPDKERMLSMLMAVIGEVSVLRERLDTVERLLDAKGTISRADIESYRPDREAGYERGVMVRDYIARVMRGPQQMMEAMQADDKPVEDLSRELKDL